MHVKYHAAYARRMASVLVLCAMTLFPACEKNQEEILPADPISSDTLVEYTIKASCIQTRTANDAFSTVWEASDSLTVYYKHGGTYESAKFKYTGDNSFVGTLKKPDDDFVWYAVYPYQESAPVSAVISTVETSPHQNGNGSMAHLAGPDFALCGKDERSGKDDILDFTMLQQLSVCKFSITNGTPDGIVIQSIEFTAPEAVAGKFQKNLTSDGQSWTAVPGESTNTIVLTVDGGAEIASGSNASFYAGTMPFSLNGNFSIKVTARCNGETIVSQKDMAGVDVFFEAGSVNTLAYTFSLPKPAGRFVKVTSAPSDGDWSGEYLIVNTEGSKAFAPLTANASNYAVDVAVVDNSYIEYSDDLDKYVVTIVQGKSKHAKDNANYVCDVLNSDGKYIYCSSNNLQIKDSRSSGVNTYYQTFTYDSSTGSVRMMSCRTSTSATAYYLAFASPAFKYSTTATNRIQLYELQEGPFKTSQTLFFANESVTWKVGQGESHQIGSSYSLPQTVSGAKTSVTYTSSDASVAEIQANSQIRIKATGTTTITATAAETSDYSSATASFTLNVRDNTVTVTDLGSFNLVNSTVDPYLTAAAATYSDSWSTGTIINQYPNGEHGDLADQSTYKMGDSRIKAYDRPAPVPIPVNGMNGSTVTVSVYNNSAKTDLEYALTATVQNGKVDFYNLIPGRTYYYTVTSGGSEVSAGQFSTTGSRRFMKVSDNIWADCANNCRDLGGLNTVYNKPIRFDRVFRGSNMNGTSDAERNYLRGYMNVKMDIDLRNKSNTKTGIDYVKDILGVGFCGEGFSGGSDLIASTSKTKIKNVFTNIINTVKAGDAVYIHCFAGADRTGYICCLLEAVCGVSEKDCSIDYELTSFSCVCVRDRTFKLKVGAAMQSCYPYITGQTGSTFQDKAVKILKDAGITDTQIEDLREALIEGYVRNDK